MSEEQPGISTTCGRPSSCRTSYKLEACAVWLTGTRHSKTRAASTDWRDVGSPPVSAPLNRNIACYSCLRPISIRV